MFTLKNKADEVAKSRILHIEPTDWKQKSPPNKMLSAIHKKQERKFTIQKVMSSEKGWIVTRIV